MSLVKRWPEVYRCLLTECPTGRMTLGGGTVLALGAMFWSATSVDGRDPGGSLFWYAFWTQVATLVGYGSIRASASIADERDARTWDLQRLTPLTSGEIAAGKLIGAPLFAAYLAALMTPWALVGAASASELNAGRVLFIYAQLAATALFAWTMSLLASAYSDVSRGGSSTTAGAMIAFGSLYTLFPVVSAHSATKTIVYWGFETPYAVYMPLATLAFAAWAFAAAKWRIGRDLLEPGRSWRFPAFCVFLILFFLGFDKSSAYFSLILPSVATVMAALAEPTTAEAWRRWRASEGTDKFDRAPAWVGGLAVVAAAAVAIMILAPLPPSTQAGAAPDHGRRLPLLLVLYLARDVFFVQSCRFTRSRRPEILAVIFLALFYIVPPMLLTMARITTAHHWFVPAAEPSEGWIANVGPAFAWAVAALLWLRERATSTSR